MNRRHITFALIGVLISSAVPSATAVGFTDFPCGDVQFVWARGTGQPIADEPGNTTFQELRDRTPGLALTRVSLGDTGTFGGGLSYPAAGGALGFLNNWTLPEIGAYRDSVELGRHELANYLSHRAQECPNEVFVLSGWSQGAEVTGSGLELLDQAVRDRVAFVALFGDPTYMSGEAEVVPFTDWCIGFPGPWVRGTGKCFGAGFFGARFPYVPSDIEQRVGSWCRAGDGSCSGILNDVLFSTGGPDGQHDKYFQADADAAMAMREATTHLKAFLPALAGQMDDSYLEFATGDAGADFAFVFDTTGSMGGSIANMKSQATALAHQWLSNSTNGRVALVDFKDQGDPYVARVDLGLTNDEAAFQNAVNALSASGGGDAPEAQLSGLMTAFSGLSWQPGATKVALVITDAMGKDPEPITGYTRSLVTQRALEIDPVAIYGVSVVNDPQVSGFMQPLADGTAGRVFTLGPNQTLSDLLSDVITGVTLSPVADLGGPYFAATGQPVHFRAVRSFDPDGTLVTYKWDFDSNGTVDQTTTEPTVDYTYPGAFAGTASVRVVAADGGQAIATADVTVDAAGLDDDIPVAPTSATATITGAGQVTVTWTRAANDRATGFTATLADTVFTRGTTTANSIVITGLNLNQPVSFDVRSQNDFGGSAAVRTNVVGGLTAWNASVRVNDNAGATDQVDPAVSLGSDGSGYVIWQDSRASTASDIYFAKRTGPSGPWATNQRVNNVTTGVQDEPDIVVDGSANSYAIWRDARNGASTPHIYFSKRSAATGTWSTNVRVDDGNSSSVQGDPAIALSPDGSLLAIWVDQRGTKKNIYASRSTNGGTSWSTGMKVTSNESATKADPDLVVTQAGTAYAVWSDARNGNADIFSASLVGGSSIWSTNVKINDEPVPGTPTIQGQPRIGADAQGALIVAYDDAFAAEIRGMRKAPGGVWSVSVSLSGESGGGGSQSFVRSGSVNVALSVASDGTAIAAWTKTDLGGNTVSSSSFDPATYLWSAPQRLDDAPAGSIAERPSIASSGARQLLAWQGGVSASDVDYDIRVRWR